MGKKEKKKQEVLEKLKEGKSSSEIAEEMELSWQTIYRYTKEFIEKGKMTKEEIKQSNAKNRLNQEHIKQIKEDKKQEILEKLKEGKSKSEIAGEIQLCWQTICNYTKELIEEGKITKEEIKQSKAKNRQNKEQIKQSKEKNKQNKEEIKPIKEDEIIRLYLAGKSLDELTVSNEKIKEIVKKISEPRRLLQTIVGDETPRIIESYVNQNEENNDKIETIKKVLEKYNFKQGQRKKLVNYIDDCKTRFPKGLLKVEEVNLIEECITLAEVDNYDNIIFFYQVCMHFSKVEVIIRFINSEVTNENLKEEDRQKVKKLREEIKIIKKKYKALQLLRKEDNIQKAMNASGLSETEVIQLKKEFNLVKPKTVLEIGE